MIKDARSLKDRRGDVELDNVLLNVKSRRGSDRLVLEEGASEYHGVVLVREVEADRERHGAPARVIREVPHTSFRSAGRTQPLSRAARHDALTTQAMSHRRLSRDGRSRRLIVELQIRVFSCDGIRVIPAAAAAGSGISSATVCGFAPGGEPQFEIPSSLRGDNNKITLPLQGKSATSPGRLASHRC